MEIVPPEGDMEFRWDSEMCWCFIHVPIASFAISTSHPPPFERLMFHFEYSALASFFPTFFILLDPPDLFHSPPLLSPQENSILSR